MKISRQWGSINRLQQTILDTFIVLYMHMQFLLCISMSFKNRVFPAISQRGGIPHKMPYLCHLITFAWQRCRKSPSHMFEEPSWTLLPYSLTGQLISLRFPSCSFFQRDFKKYDPYLRKKQERTYALEYRGKNCPTLVHLNTLIHRGFWWNMFMYESELVHIGSH